MSSVLMLSPVRSIGERFVAAFMFTHIWFLPSVRAQVGLQILQARVGLITAFKLRAKANTTVYNKKLLWKQQKYVIIIQAFRYKGHRPTQI